MDYRKQQGSIEELKTIRDKVTFSSTPLRVLVNDAEEWNWPNLGESTSGAAVLLLFPCSEKGEQSSDKLIIHQNWVRLSLPVTVFAFA